MKFLFLGFVLSFFCACATPSESVGTNLVHVEITQKKNDLWSVEYNFREPVKTVFFSRQVNQFRKDNWKVLTSGVSIQNLEAKEAFVAENYINTIKIEFKTYPNQLTKDYEFFRECTNGSQLIYTGHLNLMDGQVAIATEITFNAKKGNSIYSALGSGRKKISWGVSRSQGSYVYFGNIKPVENEFFIAVVDPGLPSWVQKSLKLNIPKLFNYYAKNLQKKPLKKPVLYLSTSLKKCTGLSISGGVTDGVLQLSIDCEGFKKYSERASERLFHTLSHEIAHVWQFNTGTRAEDSDQHAWIHEGGAEMLAFKSQLDLNNLNKKNYYRQINKALSTCINGLGGVSLDTSSQLRKFKNHYVCGTVIHYLISSGDTVENIFTVWKKLYREDGMYSTKSSYGYFFKTLDRLKVPAAKRKALQKFISKKHKYPQEGIEKLFRAFDVKYKTEGKNLRILI